MLNELLIGTFTCPSHVKNARSVTASHGTSPYDTQAIGVVRVYLYWCESESESASRWVQFNVHFELRLRSKKTIRFRVRLV